MAKLQLPIGEQGFQNLEEFLEATVFRDVLAKFKAEKLRCQLDGEVFNGVGCIHGCGHRVKNINRNFEDHVVRKHYNIIRFPDNCAGRHVNNEAVPDFDNFENDQVSDFDNDVDVAADVTRVVCEFTPSTFINSNFFKSIQRTLAIGERMYLDDKFMAIISARLARPIPFGSFKEVARSLYQSLGDKNIDEDLHRRVEQFIESDKLQQHYLSQKGCFVPPRSINIGSPPVPIGFYVDVKQLSSIILSNHHVLTSIIDEQLSSPASLFRDDLNCSEDRKSLLFGKLRIELSADDFTIKQNNNKYLAVYASFTNIPIKHRLKRDEIFLVAIADRSLMKHLKCDMNNVLQPLVDDLKYLWENGISIELEKNGAWHPHNVKVAVSAFGGDNLGVYEMIGLKMNFSYGFKCRFCGQSYADLQDDSTEDVEVEYQRPSVLLSLPYLNNNNIAPPDVLHDLAEGVVPKLLDIIIRNCVTIASTKTICQLINEFAFLNGQILVRFDEKDKRNFTFVGKAVQKLELLARFEHVFNNHIDRTKPGYSLYVALVEFTRSAFLFDLDEADHNILRNKPSLIISLCRSIEDGNTQLYKRRKGQFTVVPKLHFLSHYHELTLFWGPLSFFSSLKFERKHFVFKSLSNIVKNFKNTCLSFATHHQILLGYNLVKTNFISTNFFPPTSDDANTGAIIHTLPLNFVRLRPSDLPFYVCTQPNVVHQILHGRRQLYIQPCQFFVNQESHEILVHGMVYERKKSSYTYYLARTKFNVKKFVLLSNMSHFKDFLAASNDESYIIKGFL